MDKYRQQIANTLYQCIHCKTKLPKAQVAYHGIMRCNNHAKKYIKNWFKTTESLLEKFKGQA